MPPPSWLQYPEDDCIDCFSRGKKCWIMIGRRTWSRPGSYRGCKGSWWSRILISCWICSWIIGYFVYKKPNTDVKQTEFLYFWLPSQLIPLSLVPELQAIMMKSIAHPGIAHPIRCQALVILAPNLFIFKRVSFPQAPAQIPGQRIDFSSFLYILHDDG